MNRIEHRSERGAGGDLRGVDLNLLVALDLLLETQSVRAAARRAGVTPSAMSHTLGRLRELFGDELLVRAGREMAPTARAESLIGPLREVLGRASTLLDPGPPVDPGRLRRAFRLVCTDHVSTVLLPLVEARLRREAPGVDLYVLPLVPEMMEDLRFGKIDAAIGVFPDAAPEVRTRRLFDDHFVTVTRRRHPRLPGGAWSLEAYLAEDHALVAPRGGDRGTVDVVLEGLGVTRRVARTFPAFLPALWHVAGGDDLLTVSGRLAAKVASTLDLAVREPPVPLPGYTLSLVWHPRTDQAREDSWLRGVLVDAGREVGAAGGMG